MKFTREFLKGLGLEDAVIEQIMAAHGADVGTLKQEVTTLTAEKDQLTEQVNTYAEQVKTLKADADLTPELKKKVEDMEAAQTAQAEANAAEIAEVKKNYEIDIAISKAGARNAKAVRALLNADAVTIGEDGKPLGLAEQLEALRADPESDFLFAPSDPAAGQQQQEPPTKKPNVTFTGNATGNTNPGEDDIFDQALKRVLGE